MKQFFSLISLLFPVFLFAQAPVYYIEEPDKRQTMHIDSGRVLLGFDPTLETAQKIKILQSNPSLKPYDAALDCQQWNAVVLETQPGVSPAQILEILKALNTQSGIRYAAPFLRYVDGSAYGILPEVLVGLRSGADLPWLRNYCTSLHLEHPQQDTFDSLLYKINIQDNRMGKALDIANALNRSGIVEYAEVNYLMIKKAKAGIDPFESAQWAQENIGRYWNGAAWVNEGLYDADMDIKTAWNITKGNPNVKIAILDDGVELTHPDLVANLLPGYDGLFLNSAGGPSGNDAHGTACAGIVGAVANNSIGLAGNAPACKILPVRIAYTPAGQSEWFMTASSVTSGINWAIQNGASILSNSWGGGLNSLSVNNAIDNAVNNGRNGLGAIVIFAAGNDNAASAVYPSNLNKVIAVGATTMCDERKSPESCDNWNTWGSNYGTGLDVSAPGTWIVSTDLSGSAGFSTNDYTVRFNGTSAAAPAVASVAALILSVNPALSQTEVRRIIETTCDKVGGYTYLNGIPNQPAGSWSQDLGYGRVNALAACILAEGYCPGFANDAREAYIEQVGVDTFLNLSNNDGGYGHYTDRHLSLTQGKKYAFQLKPAFSGNAQAVNWRIWIDLNKDGDFEENGELIFSSDSATTGLLSDSLLLPVSAYAGLTRMRVAMQRGAVPLPCTQFGFGEVEDYSVTVRFPTPTGNDCELATALACGSLVSGFTAGAAQALPVCPDSLTTAPGKWYSWTAQENAQATLSTCFAGTNFDTRIAVFIGACAALECVGSNDDGVCAGAAASSTYTLNATAGVTYFIYVTGKGNASGNYRLSLDCGGCLVPGGFKLTGLGYAFAQFKWDAIGGANAYQMRYRVQGGSWTTGTSYASDQATWGNLQPNKQYEFQVRSDCGGGVFSDWSVSIFAQTLGAGDPYCYSYGLSWDNWIAQVKVDTFIHSSTSDFGYGNYTFQQINTMKGAAYPLVLSPANSGTPLNVFWRVWIDFNQDNDFTDLGEQVFQATASNNTPVSGMLNIPANAMSGVSRMRVSMSTTSYALPCQVNNSREVEDYTITIAAPLAAPVAQFSASKTCGQAPLTVQFSDLSENQPNAWNWDFGNGQNASIQNPTVTYTAPGVYTVKLSAANAGGSNSIEKTAFVVVAGPLSILADTSAVHCVGDAVALQVSGATDYTWTGEGLSALTGSNTTAQPAAPGQYVYTVQGATMGCNTEPANLTLSFNPAQTLSAVLISEGCPGPTLHFNAVVSNAGDAPLIQWYYNNMPVGTGPELTIDSAQNGDKIYFTVLPTQLPPCTMPDSVNAEAYQVSCIVSGLNSVPVIGQTLLLPNPNDGQFTLQIQLNEAFVGDLQVFNALGIRVFQEKLQLAAGKQQLALHLGHLNAGVYCLILNSPNGLHYLNFEVQH
jgi:subtilisin family serine protease/PKD repeat protein